MTRAQYKILIIEDDTEVREAWRDVLKVEGYITHEAGTTDEAIKALKYQKFNLILLDWSVPPAGREGGVVFLHSKLKNKENKDVPAIIVTGIYLKNERKKLLEKYNVIEILYKPVSNDTLCNIIHMVLNVNS